MPSPAIKDATPDTVARLSSVLSGEYRRHVLDYFETADDVVAPVSELADYVLSRQSGQDPTKERVIVRLYHMDLPKLAEAGIVTFDERSRTVRYHGHPGLEKVDDRWSVVAQS